VGGKRISALQTERNVLDGKAEEVKSTWSRRKKGILGVSPKDRMVTDLRSEKYWA